MNADDERSYVRDLIAQVADAAGTPRMQAVHQRWRDVNARRKPDRAPVWCRPVGCWHELLQEEDLRCADPELRDLERGLRRTLIRLDIDDDQPISPVWKVAAAFDQAPANTWGVEIGRHTSGVAGGSWAYDPPLKSRADMQRLAIPTFTYNEAETNRRLEQADALVGDIGLHLERSAAHGLHDAGREPARRRIRAMRPSFVRLATSVRWFRFDAAGPNTCDHEEFRDQGDNLGSLGHVQKGSPNEESIRVPFILRGPGVVAPRNVKRTHVASLVDLAPTLLPRKGPNNPDHRIRQVVFDYDWTAAPYVDMCLREA